MNAGISSPELVHLAYRLLNQDTYYDKMDLLLCANVAAYEDGRGRMMAKKQIFKAGFIMVTGPTDSQTLFHGLRGCALENNHLCLCQVDLIERGK